MARKGDFCFSKLLIALIASGLFFGLQFLAPIESTERRLLDLAFRLRGAENPHPDIVVIEIDDVGIRKTGTWPWPRRYHAALLAAVEDYKPAALFFDMVFDESSSGDDDLALAAEMKRAGNVVLPYYFPAPSYQDIPASSPILPIPLFQSKIKALGYVNAFPDPDGRVREIHLWAEAGAKSYTHASLALASAYPSFDLEATKASAREGHILINFPGPYETFRRIAFDELLARHGRGDPSLAGLLRGKIVLIGLTATGTVDLKPTAFSPLYPGVGIQASILHTLLTRLWIRKVPPGIYFPMLVFFAYLMLLASSARSTLKGIFYSASLLVTAFLLTQLSFQIFRWWVPYFTLFLAGLSLFLLSLVSTVIRSKWEAELLARELELAAVIQKNFLPSSMPKIPHLEIAAVSIPAKQVGGDLYDVFPLPGGRWGLSVGDVSGKGVPAALFMAKFISEFRQEGTTGSPAEVMRKLGTVTARESPSGLFLTLLYLIIDPATMQCVFASAGHEPLVFYEKNANKTQEMRTQKGIPLGIAEDGTFDEKEIRGQKGDILLLVSDGVRESMNPQGRMFEGRRLRSALRESSSENPGQILDHILKRIHEFSGHARQHDDLTMLCAKFV